MLRPGAWTVISATLARVTGTVLFPHAAGPGGSALFKASLRVCRTERLVQSNSATHAARDCVQAGACLHVLDGPQVSSYLGTDTLPSVAQTYVGCCFPAGWWERAVGTYFCKAHGGTGNVLCPPHGWVNMDGCLLLEPSIAHAAPRHATQLCALPTV